MDNPINNNIRFSIIIKNFGDLPASYVNANSIVSESTLTKESLKQPLPESTLAIITPHGKKLLVFYRS